MSTPEEQTGWLAATEKQPRSVRVLSAIGLVGIGAGTTFGVTYAAIVKGNEASITLLGTLATGALGALIVLAGGRNGD